MKGEDMANLFCHIELTTSDHDRARKFYKQLFPSWKLTDMKMPSGKYTLLNPGATGAGKKSAAGGGIQKQMAAGAPTGWMPYVQVPSVAKSVAKAERLGAKVMLPEEDIGMGSIAIFVDPTGAMFGIWAPAAKKPAKKKPAKRAVKKTKR
jgi:predicted enzyme related to lactoylglutathione lyase